MMKKTLGIVLLLSLWTSAVYADCFYNGESYPEGSRIGPYTCSNGRWVR